MAVQGFFLAARTLKTDNLPLNPAEINGAMRHADKTMSEKKIQAWLDKYQTKLFWKNGERKKPGERQPELYPHEFIYLVANAVDRLNFVSLF